MKHEESQIQQAFIQWCNLHVNKYPELKFIHHSPNGGKRNVKEAARFKREGVKAGFPDLILPVVTSTSAGLYIEVKTKKGRLSSSQKEWKDFLISQGYSWRLCRSVDECIKAVKLHLDPYEILPFE